MTILETIFVLLSIAVLKYRIILNLIGIAAILSLFFVAYANIDMGWK